MTQTPTTTTRRPLVAVVADLRYVNDRPRQSVTQRYLDPIVAITGASPVIIPALASAHDIPALAAAFDGYYITGSPSNVYPEEYGLAADAAFEPYDRDRDAVSLALLREVIARQKPLLCVCRGLQELNVALGGSLHPAVHELPGRLDHREPAGDYDHSFSPQHPVQFVAGGLLQTVTGVSSAMVNSLHRQAINRLAAGLIVEAEAPDHTIEAVRADHPGFALAVQWHPEYHAGENPVSRSIFASFGQALR